jgi:hypothetical protein
VPASSRPTLPAVTGLILGSLFIGRDSRSIAWISVALLGLVALVGISMLLITLRGTTNEVRTETPAEGMFPLPLVAGPGTLAATTLTLTLLAASGIGT